MGLSSDKVPLPPSWYIEPPAILDKSVLRVSALEALVRSRIVLVQLATFCSFLFLTHLVSSRLYEARCRARLCTPEGERASVPRSEWRRSRLYILFSLLVSASSVTLRYVLSTTGIGVWKGKQGPVFNPTRKGCRAYGYLDLSYLDTAVISIFYQVTLYLAIRLAHHSFTLGELGFAVFGACILFHEAMHLTIARVSHVSFFCQASRLTRVVPADMAHNNTLHQDVSTPVSPSHLSTRFDSRVHINWLPSITAAVSLTPYRPASIAETAVP